MAKLDDYKRRQLEISQRVIRGSFSFFYVSIFANTTIVICKLMVLEARGTRLTAGEEQLKRKFEMILLDLTSPILYRAKIEDFIALSRISGKLYYEYCLNTNPHISAVNTVASA